MQAEIEAGPPVAVQLLGVNVAGAEAGNALMTEGRVLPLLQDVAEVDAWALWDVTARDVVIVDPSGRAFAVYNLTDHDLAVPENYAELKGLLLEAASEPP